MWKHSKWTRKGGSGKVNFPLDFLLSLYIHFQLEVNFCQNFGKFWKSAIFWKIFRCPCLSVFPLWGWRFSADSNLCWPTHPSSTPLVFRFFASAPILAAFFIFFEIIRCEMERDFAILVGTKWFFISPFRFIIRSSYAQRSLMSANSGLKKKKVFLFFHLTTVILMTVTQIITIWFVEEDFVVKLSRTFLYQKPQSRGERLYWNSVA